MYRSSELSRARLKEYVACARKMQAEGDDILIPDDWIEVSPITVMRGDGVGKVCQIDGLMCYVIPLMIVASGRVIIRDYYAYSEWEDGGLELLYLQKRNGRYRLGPLDYAVGEVLNDRV